MKNKGLTWTYVFFLFIFVGMGYLLPIFGLNKGAYIINHIYPISGGLGIWLTVMFMTSFMGPVGSSEYYRGHNWFSKILSAIGGIATFGMFLTGTAVMVTGTVTNALTTAPEQAAIIARVNKVLYIHFALMAYSIFCLICFWIRYKVKDGTVVLLDGRILYPGEKFIMWPLYDYKAKVVEENISFILKEAEITCSDAEFEADVVTSVRFEISQARQDNLRILDYQPFIKSVKEKVESLIKFQAKNMTGGRFLSAKMAPTAEKINGFPVSWDGAAAYTVYTSGPSED